MSYSKELAERVYVHIRVRPLFTSEIEKFGTETCIETLDTSNRFISVKRDFDLKKFNFDSLFDCDFAQSKIYETVGSPAVKVLVT